MQMQGGFNANQYEPNQGGGGGHPPAQKAPFTITDTAIKQNKAGDGGFFEVALTSPMGTQIHRYNCWNASPKAVEIAYGQLSALCRATGRYQIDWSNEGAALRGGQGLMDIGYQKGEEPTAEKPQGGYTELKKVYDVNGNEPGKAPAQAQPQTAPPAQQQQPMTPLPGVGWGQPNNAAPPAQQQPQPGWNGAAPAQQPNGSAPGQAWQPGGTGPAAAPPWGNR